MVMRYIAPPERPRSARSGVAVAPIGTLAIMTVVAVMVAAIMVAAIMVADLASGIRGGVARAESLADQRQKPAPTVRRQAPLPPPVRVILPAPWEPAAPVPSPRSSESAARK